MHGTSGAHPSLAHLLRGGKRIRNPFRPPSEEEVDQPFVGKRYPTYFQFKGRKAGEKLKRECQVGKPARIEFETDAENGYFSRDVDQGTFELVASTPEGPLEVEDYSLSLNEGIATLNISLPASLEEGDEVSLVAEVNDQTQIDSFINEFSLLLTPQSSKPPGPPNPPKVPGLRLPKVVEVYQDEWKVFGFDRDTALRIKSAPVPAASRQGDVVNAYDFFVNLDNLHLKSFLKDQDGLDEVGARLVRSQFKYGLVLLGLALLRGDSDGESALGRDGRENGEEVVDVEGRVEMFTEAAAAVLLPVIRSLGELELGDEDGG